MFVWSNLQSYEVKHQFLEQRWPQSNTLVMLEDFNARVGVFDPTEGLWHRTIGSQGTMATLLHFCT